MSDQELRNRLLDEMLETLRGPKIPGYAFTTTMAAERWNCSREAARKILLGRIEQGEYVRHKKFGGGDYWYWPTEVKES